MIGRDPITGQDFRRLLRFPRGWTRGTQFKLRQHTVCFSPMDFLDFREFPEGVSPQFAFSLNLYR